MLERFQRMPELRFAIFGTGFWSRYQLAGWRELPGVRCVALFNRTRAKAEALGRAFHELRQAAVLRALLFHVPKALSRVSRLE